MAKLTMRQLRKKIQQHETAIAEKKALLGQQVDVVKDKIMVPATVAAAITGGLSMLLFRRRKLKSKATMPVKPVAEPAAPKSSRLSLLLETTVALTTLVSTLVSAKDIFGQIFKYIPFSKPIKTTTKKAD